MFFLLSAARSRGGWSKNPHHLELHLVYNLDNSCLQHTAFTDPLFPFHSLLFYVQENYTEHRSYSSFHKAAEGWGQLPTMLSSKDSARMKTKWEPSLLCPRLTFLLAFYFSAICTSQSHRFLHSLTMKPVTFLGGNCKGGVHMERLIQRDKCPGENTPTQPNRGILLLPALPGICLLHQDAESDHGSAPPSSCQRRRAWESAEGNKVFSHDRPLTCSTAASWPTSVSNKGHGLIFTEDLLQRWRLWRNQLSLSGSEALRLGVGGIHAFCSSPRENGFQNLLTFCWDCSHSFALLKSTKAVVAPARTQSFNRAAGCVHAGFGSALSNFLLLEISL